MQPSAASMSEFDATTYGAVVAATPRLMFAPKPRVVSFRMSRADPLVGSPPGLATSTSSSTCGASDSRHGPGSGSPGVQITAAATALTRAPGTRPGFGGRARPRGTPPPGGGPP